MKLSKASVAYLISISSSAQTVVVTAATTGASGTTTTTSKTTKLRGRTLQGDGSPSTIVHEDDNIGDCTVIAQDSLMIPKEGQRNLQYGDNHLEFVCEFEDGSIASMEGKFEYYFMNAVLYKIIVRDEASQLNCNWGGWMGWQLNKRSFAIETILNNTYNIMLTLHPLSSYNKWIIQTGITDEQQTELEDAMNKGQIVSGQAKIDTAKAGATKHGSKVHFPKGLNIAGNAASGRAGSANSKSKAAEATARRRELAQLVGNKYTLVVKGRFLDYPFDGKSASQISDDVFGTNDGEYCSICYLLHPVCLWW